MCEDGCHHGRVDMRMDAIMIEDMILTMAKLIHFFIHFATIPDEHKVINFTYISHLKLI